MNIHEIAQEVYTLAKVTDPDFIYTNQNEREDDSDHGYYHGANTVGEGRPCIVGQALINLGYPRVKLFWKIDTPMNIIPEILGKKRSELTSTELYDLEILDLIQEYQDAGYSWSDSYDRAYCERNSI